MHCAYLRSKATGALIAIVCGARRRARRCKCGADSSFQCDWKTGAGKTCDKHLCAKCAKEVGPEKHLCPAHQVAYIQWKAARRSPSTINDQPSTISRDSRQ